MNMRSIILGITACFFLSASSVNAVEKSCDELIAEAEQLCLDQKFDESDERLDATMKKCPKLSEPYWRKARNLYERCEVIPRDQKPSNEKLLKHYQELVALTDKGIEINKNDGNCWFWKGVGLGRYATTKGILHTLWTASKLEDIWLKTEDLKTPYRAKNGAYNGLADTYLCLGQYYRVVPEWLKYFPFKQIFDTHGDKEKSIEYQRKAVAIETHRIEYNKELAVSLICHGNSYDKPEEIEEGKKILTDLSSLPTIKYTDEIDKLHARMLLENLSLACGYQRDNQQEQSQESYLELESSTSTREETASR